MAFVGSQRGHPLLLSPLPLPLSSEGFPKGKAPKRRRGRIKRGAFEEMARLAAHQGRESYSHDGVRAAARPFVSFQGGAGGNRNPPAFLFRGPGGDILFSKENIPLASPYRNGTVPPGIPVIFAPKILSPCPVVGTTPCGSKENIPLAYFPTGFHISRPGSPAPSS